MRWVSLGQTSHMVLYGVRKAGSRTIYYSNGRVIAQERIPEMRKEEIVEYKPTPDGAPALPFFVQRWVAEEYLGQGGSAYAFGARHVSSGERVVVKIAKVGKEKQVDREIQNYITLGTLPTVPTLLWSGSVKIRGEKHTCLVIPRGTTLQTVIASIADKSEDSATLYRKVVLGIIECLQVIHEKGLVHLDVKPDNIVLIGERYVLIDYDILSKASNKRAMFLGTLKYASLSMLVDKRALSVDDLESLGYTLCFLTNPNLSCFTVTGGNVEKRKERYIEIKSNLDTLLQSVPEDIVKYIKAVRLLDASLPVPYDTLRSYFASSDNTMTK